MVNIGWEVNIDAFCGIKEGRARNQQHNEGDADHVRDPANLAVVVDDKVQAGIKHERLASNHKTPGENCKRAETILRMEEGYEDYHIGEVVPKETPCHDLHAPKV